MSSTCKRGIRSVVVGIAVTLLLVSGTWWVIQLGASSRAAQRVRRFPPGLPARGERGERGNAPSVSLIVAVPSEASHLRHWVDTKLTATYSHLEVILAVDSMAVETLVLAREIAASEDRIKVVTVPEGPPGWGRKVARITTACASAMGDWLIFSDEDVVVEPGVIEHALAYAAEERLDHLSLLPRLTPKGALLQLTLIAWLRVVAVMSRPWLAPDPDSGAAAGVGVFDLVRRTAFERKAAPEGLPTSGVADVGALVSRLRLRSAVAAAPYHLHLPFYPDLRAMANAIADNGSTLPRWGVAVGGIALLCGELGWVPSLFVDDPRVHRAAVVVVVTAYAAVHMVTRWLRFPGWVALLPGTGTLLLSSLVWRSTLVATRRGAAGSRGNRFSAVLSSLRRQR